MTGPVKCPVCGRSEIEPVLDQVTVTARYDNFEGPIGGLVVLRCKVEGHIFFVRKADVQPSVAS
jgi:hypothetical protein